VTGQDITSCVVVLTDAPITDGLTPKQRQCVDLLFDGMTFTEWYQIVKNNVSVSEKTLIRYKDLLLDKGIIIKDEISGKHPIYRKKTFSTHVEGDEYE
jgi:hypothetical protein